MIVGSSLSWFGSFGVVVVAGVVELVRLAGRVGDSLGTRVLTSTPPPSTPGTDWFRPGPPGVEISVTSPIWLFFASASSALHPENISSNPCLESTRLSGSWLYRVLWCWASSRSFSWLLDETMGEPRVNRGWSSWLLWLKISWCCSLLLPWRTHLFCCWGSLGIWGWLLGRKSACCCCLSWLLNFFCCFSVRKLLCCSLRLFDCLSLENAMYCCSLGLLGGMIEGESSSLSKEKSSILGSSTAMFGLSKPNFACSVNKRSQFQSWY